MTGVWSLYRATRRYGAAPFLAVGLVLFFSLMTPYFLTPTNVRNVLQQASVNCLIAVGLTPVMLTAGIDLSVGSIVALASILFGSLLKYGLSEPLAISVALLLCAALGALSGGAWAYLHIPSFISTLAMMSIARGLALTIAHGQSLSVSGKLFDLLRLLETASFPLSTVLAVVSVFLAHAFLRLSRAGRHVYAVGDNLVAAARQGIQTQHVVVGAFAASAALSALGGLLVTIRLSSAQPIYGYMYELDGIAAAVIGGVSLSGGRGSALGAALGALVIALMRNGLTLLDVDAYAQHLAVGLILLIASRLYGPTN